MDNTEKYYKTYIDVLTLAASFSVVWIHFGNEIHWYDGTLAWKMCVPIQVFAYWAVPVYFMKTGATLMNYRQKYTTTVFFRRRLVRGVMPYLIWGTLMIFLDSERVFVQGSSMAHKTSSILNAFINSTMEPVYWFFIPLLSVYLSMPILSLLAEKQNRKLLHYALALGVLLISVIPFSYNLFYYVFRPEQNFYWNQLLSMPVLGGYTLYCVLGYWAATHNFTKKRELFAIQQVPLRLFFVLLDYGILAQEMEQHQEYSWIIFLGLHYSKLFQFLLHASILHGIKYYRKMRIGSLQNYRDVDWAYMLFIQK